MADFFHSFDPWRLGDLERKASHLQNAADQDADRIHELSQRVTQLALTCAAMWELLKKNAKVSEEDLKQQLDVLRANGVAPPGIASPDHVYCLSCDHKISPTATRCLYCGAAVTPQGAM